MVEYIAIAAGIVCAIGMARAVYVMLFKPE